MNTTFALEYRINFLFEKWNKSYIRYDEVNLAEEKLILCQEPFRCNPELSGLAGRGGA